MTLPQMVNSTDNEGDVTEGFMHASLSGILGIGSFDSGNELTRFSFLLDSNTSLGDAFGDAWRTLQLRCADPAMPAHEREVWSPEEGVLSVPAAAAGWHPTNERVVEKMQREITHEIEQVRYRSLNSQISILSTNDQRRKAWSQTGRTSQRFVASVPKNDFILGNTDFRTTWENYYGLPCSLAAPHVGMRLPGGKTLDAYGNNLSSINVKGDGHRIKHDINKWNISELIESAGVRADTEVFGLFFCIHTSTRTIRTATVSTTTRSCT